MKLPINPRNYIFGTAGANVLTSQETIQWAATIGKRMIGLINKGTILGNQSNTLIILD